MFPIFQKAAYRDVPLPTHDWHMIPGVLEGMDERSIKQLKQQTLLNSIHHSNTLAEQLPFSHPEILTNAASSTRDEQGGLYKLDDSRRKRRKVTPSNHEETCHSPARGSRCNKLHVHASDHGQPASRECENDQNSLIHPDCHEVMTISSVAGIQPQPGKIFTHPRGSGNHPEITVNLGQNDSSSNEPVFEKELGPEFDNAPKTSERTKTSDSVSPETSHPMPNDQAIAPDNDGTAAKIHVDLIKQGAQAYDQAYDDGNAKKMTNRHMKTRNGKFVQSFEVILAYGRGSAAKEVVGQRINNILSTQSSIVQSSITKTHPFFLSKKASSVIRGPKQVSHVDDIVNDTDSISSAKAPVAWHELKFSSSKSTMFKSTDSIPAIWPPRGYQTVSPDHIGWQKKARDNDNVRCMKLKTKQALVDEREDILRQFGRKLREEVHSYPVFLPQRRLLSGNDIVRVQNLRSAEPETVAAIASMNSLIVNGSSAFDRGETSGQQTWTTKYAPTSSQEVLQPSCQILRDWLRTLAVHNVQGGADQAEVRRRDKPSRKKRRQKRNSDELDDFIVDDDNECLEDSKTIKNVILISGPTGCGKTASVFAVARELGFEVFEIHPGMRRNAKDIFDKVGDMTQNHLVQSHDATSRGSSVAPPDIPTMNPNSMETNQPSMTNFLGAKKAAKTSIAKSVTNSTTTKKEQKQSLILFEEVDILFDSDKSFWTGVQNLLLQSRRPVVMTCNDISRIPMQELEIYAKLQYSAPQAGIAAEYLTALAAAEGHLITSRAVETLYASKGNDIRASINELSFWCQMTVGSKQGGLDWMFASESRRKRSNSKGEKLRICSEGTFQTGLDLIPEVNNAEEELLRRGLQEIGLSTSAWIEHMRLEDYIVSCADRSSLEQLDFCADFLESRSAIDIVSEEVSPTIASAIHSHMYKDRSIDIRAVTSATYIQHLSRAVLSREDIVKALNPITLEKPTFPPSQGRLAPSIDAAYSTVALDVAPYVRAIVLFDKHLEQRREELFGSQGRKARHTRAARAAAEGGDKARTRAEHWFPKNLDFTTVLSTGNDWPLWPADPCPYPEEFECSDSETQVSNQAHQTTLHDRILHNY